MIQRATLEALTGFGHDATAYGHLHILQDYCGVSASTPLVGTLQHGFCGAPELALYEESMRSGSAWPFRQYVYSQETVSWAESLGVKHVCAIGAPWLYLLDLIQESDIETARGSCVDSLLIVTHSVIDWDRTLVERVLEEFVTSSSGSRAVMLAWDEVAGSPWPSVCRESGISVRTAGHPEWPFAIVGGSYSPHFLERVHAILGNSKEVFVDSVGSAAIYAASLGRRVVPLDMEWMYEAPGPMTVEALDFEQRNLVMVGRMNQSEQRSWALRMLGAESMQTPEELRRTLGWSSMWGRWRERGRAVRTAVEGRIVGSRLGTNRPGIAAVSLPRTPEGIRRMLMEDDR